MRRSAALLGCTTDACTLYNSLLIKDNIVIFIGFFIFMLFAW